MSSNCAGSVNALIALRDPSSRMTFSSLKIATCCPRLSPLSRIHFSTGIPDRFRSLGSLTDRHWL
jgi:hypothetical protein